MNADPTAGASPLDEDAAAARLRGFGPTGIIAALLIVLAGNIRLPGMLILPLGALLALAWVRASRTPWSEVGFVRPTRWWLVIVIAAPLGVAFKLLMKAVVMPLLGAPEVNEAYAFLQGASAVLPMATLSILIAAFAEETVFRGFLFERLKKLLGSSHIAVIAIVCLTSVLFGAGHAADQGLAGAQQAIATGLLFGSMFAITRSLWAPMIAHAAFNLTALAIIYLGLETTVARWIFG